MIAVDHFESASDYSNSASSPPACSNVDQSSVLTWSGEWIVVGVNSQHWERAIDGIRLTGNRVYCPVAKQKRMQGGRSRWISAPMFKGYAFVNLAKLDFDIVRRVPDVKRIVTVNDQSRLAKELRQFQLSEGDLKIDLFPSFAAGARVQVATGPFRGFEGRIITRKSHHQFGIECTFFGQITPLDIEGAKLDLI